MSVIMSQHAAPFVRPAKLESTARNLDALGKKKDNARTIAVHVLDLRCRCSLQVLNSLGKARDLSVSHIALLLSVHSEEIKTALRQKAVTMRQSSVEEVKKEFQIESVPWLLVLSPDL